jgi:hypothetical protein
VLIEFFSNLLRLSGCAETEAGAVHLVGPLM